MMKPSTVLLMLVIGIASIGWISPAGAAIDPANPDWLIYRDPFGTGPVEDPSYYDQYAEVEPGDTLTLHVVVNFNTGDWTQIHSYHSAFWYNTAVVENFPTPNYAWSWMGNMANPFPADYQANGYVQLYNYNYMGSAQNAWEEPASAPFVLVSWDLQISPTAPLGTTTIPMRWRSYNINAAYSGPQDWNRINAHSIEHDPAFTINVVPADVVLGDFDDDDDVDADDIDILCDNMGGDPDPYDVDGDGDVDENDLVVLIETLVELQDGSGRIGTKQGDFNLDGFVNGTDLALMKNSFGQPGMKYADGNANCDAFVNGTDLAIMKASFGFSAPPAGGVPEPMTLLVMAAAGLPLLLKRKRKSRA